MTEPLKPKPWVQVACVCEKALREPDNVASLIRIVDTYSVSKEPLPAGITPGLPLTIAVLLKSGEAVGAFELVVRLTRPDGQESQIGKWPLVLKGGEHGVNLLMTFGLEAPALGLYWFDVLWADEVLTRIPLRIKATTADETSRESTGSEMSQQVAR